MKFTTTGGRVEVRLTQSHHARLQVVDKGKGIHSESLPYVFEHFRQEDGATTRKFGGLGLGLAIARQIVELHGGRIWVESPGEDQGATFTLLLPLLLTQNQQYLEPLPLVETDNLLAGIRVLVVDDEPDIREIIGFSLEQSGANVRTVDTARDALTALAQFQPDVLISDIGMPNMDGYMLLREVRALSPEQQGQVPAIALTAHVTELDQRQALQAGFQKHLSKPIGPDHLVIEIVKLLGNS